ncbi:putative invertase inhibitor [Salvia splendens]|uniref:putative invertase inhibitor n=1 Tax=Salvia splendens TaxID=180675 RepID=UPI001C267902|nr:putative invertase inhibitor [Salvia splendens]
MKHTWLLIFFLSITIHLSSSQSLLNTTCKAMSADSPNIKYGFCATSLQAAPASQCASTRGLATISIRALRYNVTDTRCFIKQLLKNRRWDPYAKQCLGDCFDLYSDAISTVKQAMKDFNARRFDDANVRISSVMDAATTCEDAFAEGGNAVVSPLTKRNADAFQIGAMALSVVGMIRTGSG